MTMVGLPLALLLYIVAALGMYGLLGLGVLFVGRTRGRPSIERVGYSVALASGALLLTYGTAFTLWLNLSDVDSFVQVVGTGLTLLLLSPVVVVIMPPAVASVLYIRDDIRQHAHRSVGLSFAVFALFLAAFTFLSIVIRHVW